MNIEDLIFYEKNAKEHDIAQIDKIIASIERFGFNVPIVIDKDNVIVAGHGRYMACRKMGITEVRLGAPRAAKGERFIPVVKIDDLTDAEIKAYRIADNKLNKSEWIMEMVKSELHDIQAEDPTLIDLTGFSQTDMDPVEEVDDEIAIDKKYEVSVIAMDEREQEKIYNALTAEGYNCKVVTI